ncbi:type II toxin-antitoxin system ParD family antitoxin [Sphingobium boeckii]|nr:type II toxin-antitoxin system ParD family antitoxin [Sphingobium boeckii]
MNISLPGPLKAFIDSQVADGRYSSVSEYVRELVRADEKRKAQEKLETMLLEGLASPESSWVSSDLDGIRAAARAGH